MDYDDNDCVKRLNYVVEGEQSGISKITKWNGGGSFIKLELAKNNKSAKEHILNCKSFEELITYFDELYTKYFLHYNWILQQIRGLN